MPKTPFATLAATLSMLSLHMTRPSFLRMIVLIYGWVLAAPMAGQITAAILAANVSELTHWAAFHRLFSRAPWSLDGLGAAVFRTAFAVFKPCRVQFVLDDTLTHRPGKHVFGATMHVDPVSSTRGYKNFVHGHCWVVLALVVDVPWSTRPWALPLLFRLYRGKAGGVTKCQLARQMLMCAATWSQSAADLLVDSAYMTRDVLRELPPQFTVIGAIRANAALSRAPVANHRGRPRKRGERLPTPRLMAEDPHTRWKSIVATLYQKRQRKEALSFVAQWYHVCGQELVRIVLVREHDGMSRVFACTNPQLGTVAVLERYARRWSVEVWFREIKQLWGMGDGCVRSEKAVLRLAPWVGLMSSLLVVWFQRSRAQGLVVSVPVRPWYRHKTTLSMADVLRAAQQTLRRTKVTDLLRAIGGKDALRFSQRLEREESTKNSPTPAQSHPMAA